MNCNPVNSYILRCLVSRWAPLPSSSFCSFLPFFLSFFLLPESTAWPFLRFIPHLSGRRHSQGGSSTVTEDEQGEREEERGSNTVLGRIHSQLLSLYNNQFLCNNICSLSTLAYLRKNNSPQTRSPSIPVTNIVSNLDWSLLLTHSLSLYLKWPRHLLRKIF